MSRVEVAFTKTTIIGGAVEGEGDQDLLGLFFSAVENDSREGMTSVRDTEEHYQMVTTTGTTNITVSHKPEIDLAPFDADDNPGVRAVKSNRHRESRA